ncbi:uncharacterized protein [Cardiocondyla obscurior]
MSFTIFLIIVTIITWSAVHLGKKGNSASIGLKRYPYMAGSSIERKNISLHSAKEQRSMLQVIESTTPPTLFANDQGSEIPDIERLFEILQTFYPNNTVNKTNYGAVMTTFARPVIKIDSIRNDSITTTLYNTSNKTLALDNRQNASDEITTLSNILQRTYSTLFDANQFWRSNLSESVGTELPSTEQSRDEENKTSKMFSFAKTLSDVEESNVTQRINTMRAV